MNAPLPPASANNGDQLVPAPASRLGPALAWLGHGCAAADGIQVHGRRRNRGGRALTVLDPGIT